MNKSNSVEISCGLFKTNSRGCNFNDREGSALPCGAAVAAYVAAASLCSFSWVYVLETFT